MKEQYGVDSMPETAENVATDYKIEREAQDRMALASQLKAVAAQKSGFFDAEIAPVSVAAEEGRCRSSSTRTSIRARPALEALAKLKGVVRPDGTRDRRQRQRASTTAPARCCWPTKRTRPSTA